MGLGSSKLAGKEFFGYLIGLVALSLGPWIWFSGSAGRSSASHAFLKVIRDFFCCSGSRPAAGLPGTCNRQAFSVRAHLLAPDCDCYRLRVIGKSARQASARRAAPYLFITRTGAGVKFDTACKKFAFDQFKGQRQAYFKGDNRGPSKPYSR
jgi:hypothetical protein